MPDIYISKTKLRRGTDAQRQATTLDQGELVFTTDTDRLFVGFGGLGGIPASAKIHPAVVAVTSLSTINAQVGDLVPINSRFYQLTANPYSVASNWADMGIPTDSTLTYGTGNVLKVATGGLSASHLASNIGTAGIKNAGGFLQVDYNTSFFQISANQLSVNPSAITARELASSIWGNGLSGGAGNTITLTVNPSAFCFVGGVLNAYPIAIDTQVFRLSTGGALTMLTSPLCGVTNEFSRPVVDAWGKVIDQKSSIYSTLSGNSALSGFNNTNSLSGLFNGTPVQSLSGGMPGVTITQFTAVSGNGLGGTVTVVLSSAGFLTFQGGYNAQDGSPIGRFAIPIFAY